MRLVIFLLAGMAAQVVFPFSVRPVTAQEMPCKDGLAGEYPCLMVHLMAQMSISQLKGGRGAQANDIWGWTDAVTGNEYALVGLTDGVAFVDISEPQKPLLLGTLPTHSFSSTWRDIKVFDDYAFVVSEAGDHGMQVFDLHKLRDSAEGPVTYSESAHYSEFGGAHNLVINEDSGFAYAVGTRTCEAGLHGIDISSPLKPSFAGCYAEDGYTHDAQCVIYKGPFEKYQGREVCFNANEDTVTIVDVTDKEKPFKIGQAGYPDAAYVHQGWLSEDHRYFYQDDELDGGKTRTLIWDMIDLEDPQVVGDYLGVSEATDHNLYVWGNYVYQANYRAGLRILDISKPLEPIEIGFFDTYPENDNSGFSGAWSTYPYFKSGLVIVSDIGEGLFVVKPEFADPELPVELLVFEALVDGRQVRLHWSTAGESNNAGFEIQQQSEDRFEMIGFVEGHGTTDAAQDYAFLTVPLSEGRHTFRLKQIDFDGAFVYSEEVVVTLSPAAPLDLSEAHPNPFNPETIVTLSVARGQRVRVEVFNVQGQQVGSLFDEFVEPDQVREIRFEAGALPSGSYLIRATGDAEIATRLVSLVK